MRKILAMAVSLFILLSSSVSAHGTAAGAENSAGFTVRVNGVEVKAAANYWSPDGKAYVSIKAFADLFGKSFTVSEGHKVVIFNGKTISDIQMKQGELTAWIRDLASAVSAQNVSWDDANREVYVLALPEGSIKISEVVRAMGEHWANPQAGELPVGPVYGVHNGKLVFLEYMIAQEDFVKGNNLVNLNGMKGVPSPAVVQLDLEFQPQGHPGFEAQHYDIHAYFITDEEQQKIK